AIGKKGHKRFPLLIKLIDATGDLSIQVHPDDAYALANENQLGKTEMWYIADAEDGACIYYGFNRDVTADELREAVRNGTLCELLNKIPVKQGDTFFVEAGTVHALLAGITVIEIQQNSGLTYRLYDYDRRDDHGNLRELHIEKAIAVANITKKEIPDQEKGTDNYKDYKIRPLADCPYFKTREIEINGIYPIFNGESFVTFTVAEGEGFLYDGTAVTKGDTVFVPAGCNTSINGTITIIETTL
ncbi:MAG: class I mannose-6-phosphate isomerase, partial [Clostridia bacterium]|nr:class I mannose-6-phosphate isomerase [Clostridia bacterium]